MLLLNIFFRDTLNGGPVHWIHENYRCPNCYEKPNHHCCQNVPAGQFCKADSVDIKDDPDVSIFSIFFKANPYIGLL